MANRFPLILDSDDGNRIKELPSGDSLDLDGAGIVNLATVSVSGEVAAATLTSSGALNVTGTTTLDGALVATSTSTFTGQITANGGISATNVTASGNVVAGNVSVSSTIDAGTYTVGGQPLSSIQVQSNWNSFDINDPAFIQNKPDIPVLDDTIFQFDDVTPGVASPGDIPDGYVLTWVAAQGYFEPLENAGGGGGGVDLTAFSVVEQPNSGTGRLVYDNTSGVFTYTPPIIPSIVTNAPSGTGSIVYTSADGTFTYTPPQLPENTSELVNDGAPGGGGAAFITNGDLSVTQEAAAGLGALSYDTGVFTYTPPVIPANTSDLVNDSNFVSLTAIDAAKYLQMGDIIVAGNITISTDDPADGQVTIGIDDSSYLTQETDTLQSVTTRGASTTDALQADAFNQAPTSTSTNTLKDVDIETLSILTSITSTNGNFSTTNGNITATNGTVTGAFGSFATQLDGGGLTLTSNTISSTSGNISINAAGKVIFSDGGFNLLATTLPGSPSAGDMYYSNNALYLYVNDDGSASPGWIVAAGPGNGAGATSMSLPVFENTDFPTGQEGMLLYDLTDSVVRVYNGSTWATV